MINKSLHSNVKKTGVNSKVIIIYFKSRFILIILLVTQQSHLSTGKVDLENRNTHVNEK